MQIDQLILQGNPHCVAVIITARNDQVMVHLMGEVHQRYQIRESPLNGADGKPFGQVLLKHEKHDDHWDGGQ